MEVKHLPEGFLEKGQAHLRKVFETRFQKRQELWLQRLPEQKALLQAIL
jgi:hypothetical protein